MKKEKEIEETISFTIAMKRIKYLEISLPKETKDMCVCVCVCVYIYIYIKH